MLFGRVFCEFSVREAVRRGFNLTEVAVALHTSQPGISRQIRELENELGVELFARAGKRLLGMTEAGGALLPIIDRMLTDAESLRRAGLELQGGDAKARAFVARLVKNVPVLDGGARASSLTFAQRGQGDVFIS